MCTCMYNWVTIMLYSRKLTEPYKPAIMKKNHYIYKKNEGQGASVAV